MSTFLLNPLICRVICFCIALFYSVVNYYRLVCGKKRSNLIKMYFRHDKINL